MCKILTEKNHLCLHKGVYSVKRLSFAQQCGRSFEGVPFGVAVEGTTNICLLFWDIQQKKVPRRTLFNDLMCVAPFVSK